MLLDSLNFEAHSDVTAQHHNEDGRKKGEKIVYRLTNFQFNAIRGKTIDEREKIRASESRPLALIGLASGCFYSPEDQRRKRRNKGNNQSREKLKARKSETTGGSLDNKLTFQERRKRGRVRSLFVVPEKKD